MSLKSLKLLVSVFLLAMLLTTFVLGGGFLLPEPVSSKLSQLASVFLSIIIQTLPFILIGVLGSALIQHLISVDLIERILMRKSKLTGILLAVGAGFFFPVCDCGVFLVVRRLLVKKVPPYMAVAFLITAPLINPVTVWATATAFGYNLPVALIRVGIAIFVGITVALAVGKYFPTVNHLLNNQSAHELEVAAAGETTANKVPVFSAVMDHATVEFFEIGKYLITGALFAASVQTYLPKQALLFLTGHPVLSVLVMMVLAVSLSLCSEADAFVARSFTYHFPIGSVMAFMVYGQMIDIKNSILLLKNFKSKAAAFIFGLAAVMVLIICFLLNLFFTTDFLKVRF